MKILVLCGDSWHRPQVAREGLSGVKETEITFDWIEDAGDGKDLLAQTCTIGAG